MCVRHPLDSISPIVAYHSSHRSELTTQLIFPFEHSINLKLALLLGLKRVDDFSLRFRF
jgi:hypothetical protein